MSELFDLPESLSPRLAWLKRHSLVMIREGGKWVCVLDEANLGRGETEVESCEEFCVKTGLRHWSA